MKDEKTGENVKRVIPLFAVSDMEESVRFYVDGLSFKMNNKWAKGGKLRWCSLVLGGSALMLAGVREGMEERLDLRGNTGQRRDILLHLRGRPQDLPRYHRTRNRGLGAIRWKFQLGHIRFGSRWVQTQLREPYQCRGRNQTVRGERVRGAAIRQAACLINLPLKISAHCHPARASATFRRNASRSNGF